MTDERNVQLEVAIVGAGPAGSVAAILLARAGWHVRLIEQYRFPRRKVCGECLSALGQDVLTRLGLSPTIAARDPVRLTKAVLHARDGSSSVVRLPRAMLGISRTELDGMLLEAARAAGACVAQPARCERVIDHPQNATLLIRSAETNKLELINASMVLVADGKAAVGLGSAPPRTADLGVKAHLAGIDAPRDAIELFGFDGHYGGLAPIEGDCWNLAMSVPITRVAACRGDHDRLLEELMNENRALAVRFRDARRTAPWQTCPLPRFGVARRWPARVIPMGNAAASIEPIGGEGMGLAMRSAELVATELIAARNANRPIDTDAIRAAFVRLWKVRSIACRAAALGVSTARFARIFVDGASIAPLADAGLFAIGKHS